MISEPAEQHHQMAGSANEGACVRVSKCVDIPSNEALKARLAQQQERRGNGRHSAYVVPAKFSIRYLAFFTDVQRCMNESAVRWI
jgi:hypothetical protein